MVDNCVVFVERTRSRRRSMNSSSHHHNRPRRHVVMTYTVLIQVRARTMQLAAPAAQSPSAAERISKALAELCTHETVGDRVAARRDERQQVYVVHGGRRDMRDGIGVVEDAPRLHHVHRSPTDEEQNDDDGQHLDAASLGANATSTC